MVKIPEFPGHSEQMANMGRHHWSVARLSALAKDLPVMEIPLDHLNIYQKYETLTLREMVMHMRTTLDADLSFPIILDEDGDLMDGRHRIMKALLNGEKTIKAVRFEENPHPCRIDD